jgi:hypothetical protein
VALSRGTVTTALAGIGLAALLLTGCSDPAPASSGSKSSSSAKPDSSADAAGQTKAEACDAVKAGVSDTITQLQGGIGDLQSDPAAAVAAVNALADAFETTGADVTNDEVGAVVDGATASLTAFAAQIEAYAANPEAADQTAVQSSATAVQESLLKLGTTCA